MATRLRLSEHFTIEEFDCNDGTRVPRNREDGCKRLARLYLEPMRAKYGRVNVNSGYRHRRYNASIGGEPNSYHIYNAHPDRDQACDISCARGTPREWWATLNAIRRNKRGGNGGLGLYSTFCHIDLRDYPANWRG